MPAPKKLPTVPYEPGDGDKSVRALRSMSRAATGRSPKGPLPDESTEDAVTEIERALEWATRGILDEET